MGEGAVEYLFVVPDIRNIDEARRSAEGASQRRRAAGVASKRADGRRGQKGTVRM